MQKALWLSSFSKNFGPETKKNKKKVGLNIWFNKDPTSYSSSEHSIYSVWDQIFYKKWKKIEKKLKKKVVVFYDIVRYRKLVRYFAFFSKCDNYRKNA
jgi:hypothetical protein